MTQTEQLIASLTAIENTSYYLPDTEYYFDWSTGDAEIVTFEAGDSGSGVQIPMTREDLISLQQRLTAYLIATA